MRQSWKWVPSGADRSELVIGDEQWPLPIPLAKAGSGWQFDTDAGKDEILSRRIGRNELRVIDLCRAYVLMQQEYASQPRDGKLAGLYAQQLRSDPGRQNGLYWEVGPEERRSPLGDVAPRPRPRATTSTRALDAVLRVLLPCADGPGRRGEGRGQGLHRQRGDVRGFGLVAYPAEYGRSGVMTFVVNQDGVVYESDLGEDTAKTASN